MPTSSVSACNIGFEAVRKSSPGSKVIGGDCRYVDSLDISTRRYYLGYIYASLMVVYYYGVGVAPKVKHRHNKTVSPQLLYMLIQSARLHGCASRYQQCIFFQSGCVLKDI